jgi:methyl-accepting chemotaxis protein
MRSIQTRLRLQFGALVCLIVAFIVVHFPAQQRAQHLAAFTAELRARGDAIALALGIGLEHHDFASVQRVFGFATSDGSLEGIQLLDPDDRVIAAYPESASRHPVPEPGSEVSFRGREVSYRVPIRVGGEVANFVVLTRSLAALESAIARSRYETLALGALVLLVTLTLVQMLASRWARPIEELRAAAREVERGRLGTRVSVTSEDELGALGHSFNAMAEQLRQIASQVRGGSQAVDAVGEELTAGAEQLASGAGRQTEAVTAASAAVNRVTRSVNEVADAVATLAGLARETSSSIAELDSTIASVSDDMEALTPSLDAASLRAGETLTGVREIVGAMGELEKATGEATTLLMQLAAMVRRVDHNATECGDLSREVRDHALRGRESVQQNHEAMQEVREGFDSIESRVRSLVQVSNAVEEILAGISEVTDQTNLLALNAAIIAAQAGEHGRPFAVVAGQVKQLAQRTTRSTGEITALIDQVKRETGAAVEAVEWGAAAVQRGLTRAGEVETVLGGILERASRAAERVGEIGHDSTDQASRIEEVERAMHSVGVLAQRTYAATQEQDRANSQIFSAVDHIRELGSQATRATREQRERSRQMTRAVEEVSADSLEVCGDVGSQSSQLALALQERVEALVERSAQLRRTVERLEA